LVNSAIEECNIDDLGVVVLDELHMIDDAQRGYLIEIMVTKLILLQQDVQIIGMSATLSVPILLPLWTTSQIIIAYGRGIN
jgi:DNA polymerase theta